MIKFNFCSVSCSVVEFVERVFHLTNTFLTVLYPFVVLNLDSPQQSSVGGDAKAKLFEGGLDSDA